VKRGKTEILIYAHWVGMPDPKCMGTLSVNQAKGRKAYSFEYNHDWLRSKERFLLDPDIGWYSGRQFPVRKDNFGIFLDSMPDSWGRTLMKRRAVQKAREEGRPVPTLDDIDFLLGVYDESRLGALRFKLDINGPFLDDSKEMPIPPWSYVRELQHASHMIESEKGEEEMKKWLAILLAPGSSLGGGRPKANILDNDNHLWIAKFPSRHDTINKALWEFLAYRLAVGAGIWMADSNFEKIAGHHHTFFTKRFDRANGKRVHFASAMTMTGNNEDIIRDNTPSYLDLAEFIQFSGVRIEQDLHQLWRRMVFNIAISNTDDHLRNHGFVLEKGGWRLSPAYDINPSIDKDGLSLNIDTHSNALDFGLAKSTGEYFQIKEKQMDKIITDIRIVVRNWETVAREIGIPGSEREMMAPAFRF